VVILIILTFIAVFLVTFGVYFAVTTAKESPTAELRRRLRRLAQDKRWDAIPEGLRGEIIKEIPPFEKFISHIPFLRNLDRLLDQAGVKTPPTKFLLMTVAIILAAFLLGFALHKNIWLGLIAAAIAAVVPYVYLKFMKMKRAEKFTEQLPDALTMISRSLRAGHSLSSAIELVGQEMSNPVGELFKTAFDQQTLGLRVTDTLANMTERMESLDLRFFVTVISINTEVGGNLAEILDKLADTIRERLKIRRQVRVYTAQGRMSGYLLAALPIVAFVMMHFVMVPGYEDVLIKEKGGQLILLVAVVMQGIGFLVIRKIINIRI
jgi:tight adherence protein B